jgi:hypothetical protein
MQHAWENDKYKILVGSPAGKRCLQNLGIGRRIIKWILRK